jgi:hypothetical protein
VTCSFLSQPTSPKAPNVQVDSFGTKRPCGPGEGHRARRFVMRLSATRIRLASARPVGVRDLRPANSHLRTEASRFSIHLQQRTDSGLIRATARFENCHNVCHSWAQMRGMAGDTKGLFWLVRLFRESLQDNRIQPVSDWGSSGRRFKSCQPDGFYQRKR